MATPLISAGLLHTSVEWNKRADEVEKAAVLRPSHACPLLYGDLFYSIHPVCQQRCVADQLGCGECHYKDGRCHCQGCRSWSNTHVRGCRTKTDVTRLWTGHTHLIQGFLMPLGVKPHFDDCLVPWTLQHLVVECPSLNYLRERYRSLCRDDESSRLSL